MREVSTSRSLSKNPSLKCLKSHKTQFINKQWHNTSLTKVYRWSLKLYTQYGCFMKEIKDIQEAKRGQKRCPTSSPKRKLLHVLMPKTLTLFKTKILLLFILPLVFCLWGCICWCPRCIEDLQPFILSLVNLPLLVPSIGLFSDACSLNL